MIRSESFLCTCRANCIDHQQALRPLRRHNSATVTARCCIRFRFVVSSALIDQLAEYSVPGQTIVHGSFIGTVTITEPSLMMPGIIISFFFSK